MNTDQPNQNPTPPIPNTQSTLIPQSINTPPITQTPPTQNTSIPVQDIPSTTQSNSTKNTGLPLESTSKKEISLKKVITILISSIVAIVLLFAFVTTPLVKDLSKCYETASEELTKGQVSAKNQGWSKQQICLNGKEIMDLTILCFNKAEQGRLVSIGLITNIVRVISPGIKQLSEFKQIHNQACQQFPLLLVN